MKECELIKEDQTFGLLTVKLFPKFIGNVLFGHQGFVKNQFVTVGLFKVHLLVKQYNSIKASYNLIVGMTDVSLKLGSYFSIGLLGFQGFITFRFCYQF